MLPMIETSAHVDQGSNPSSQRAPDTPDCLHYKRTGTCNYGSNCRFNHPPFHKLPESGSRGAKEEHPERLGEPECQFFLKTGACKFGLACKFHHPKEKAGIMAKAFINEAGYPLRLGEKDCGFYMQTGTCRFGVTCKFNHPQPTCHSLDISGRPMYTLAAATQTCSSPVFPSWTFPGVPYISGFPHQRPCFFPMLVTQNGFISMLSWTASQGSMRPLMPPSPAELKHQTFDTTAIYGGKTSQNIYGPYSPDVPYDAVANYSCSRYPERPGQPECKYFLKTGDCKFGTACWFDHPNRRSLLPPSYILSPMGLPQRPGIEPCTFYLSHGTCKFGSSCRYDHPWSSSMVYSPSAKSFIKRPLLPYPLMRIVPKPLQPALDTINAATMQDNERENMRVSGHETRGFSWVLPVAEHSGMGVATPLA